MHGDIDPMTLWTANRLLAGSLQAVVVVALVWLTCRHVPRLTANVQATLWWLATLKLVLVLLPLPAISVPVLPSAIPSPVIGERPPAAPAGEVAAHARQSRPRPAAWAESLAVRAWLHPILVLWLAVLAGHAVRLLLTLRRLRGLVRRSVPWTAAERPDIAGLAARVGLRRLPDIRMSTEIDTPQVVGLVSPCVLLPADAARRLTWAEREMAICHELTHIRRHDLLLGLVPALAERLFFFHPFVRLAAREYLTAREGACDASVIRVLDVPPIRYGRLLVRLGVVRADAALVASSAAVSTASLKRRLTMLHHTESPSTPRVAACVAAGMLLTVLPVQLVARAPAQPAAEARVAAPAAATAAVVQAVVAPVPPLPSRPPRALPAMSAPAAGQQPAVAAPQDEASIRAGREALAEQAQAMEERARAVDEITNALIAARRSLQDTHPEVQRLTAERTRAMLELMQQEAAQRQREVARASAEAPRRVVQDALRNGSAAEFVNRQLENVARQQEVLVRQQQQLAEQQQVLAETQRRLSDEAARIREVLERAVQELRSNPPAAAPVQ